MTVRPKHVALQFGHIKHFNEGLAEFSRQLAMHLANQAPMLRAQHGLHLHFIMPSQWHGMFGPDVRYHALNDSMRMRHRFEVDLDVWHGLNQHMRYRPPVNSQRNIVTVHDLNHIYAKTGPSLWWQDWRLTRHLRRAHQLIAISQYAADDMARHLPKLPPARIIHNGAADLTNSPQACIDPLVGQPYMLHISRMSPSKNVAALLDMAAIWPEQPLVLAGPDSPEVQAHKAQAKAQGLHHVHFLTDVSEAQKTWLYANCTAFLFPSLMEGFGLPPIEAMFFGKPVIVARRSCLPEICGDGAAYWNDFDPLSMKQTVQAAMRPDIASRLKQQAMARAAHFTWHHACARYLDLYSE